VNEQNTSTDKGKWARIVAIIFAALFAIFWSLDSFFFWSLLGGLIYFTFLTFHLSGAQLNFFQRNQNDRDPHRYENSARPGSQVNPAARIVRIVVFSVIGFFMFLILIGIFFGEETPAEENAEPSQQTTSNVDMDDNSKGNAFFSDGNYDSALWYYERVLAKNSQDRDGLYNKSLVYFMKKEYRRSIPLARKCLTLYPDNNDAWWLLGDNYYEISYLDSAVYALEKAYGNDFRETAFLQLMGEVYLKRGARDKAKESYLQVIKKDSSNVEAFRALIELDPDNADRYRNRVTRLEQAK
jgi:tetratricopeptide (TPR) repeat protein